MLVIISDIHLTDGSSGETVHQGTLRVFRERLRNLAYAASWRTDGKYRPIQQIDILLLGDFLDVLRSSRWLEERSAVPSTLRPWDDPASPEFIGQIGSITESIIENNAVFFEMMRELCGTAIASVPQATEDSRPQRTEAGREGSPRIAVPVRIHYMVGNHDWFFHLPHPEYREIRRALVQNLALDNDPDVPFPHDLGEPGAKTIRRVLNEHGVFARHGDIYDPFNFEGHRDCASLGDAIVIDLVTRFAVEVKARLGDVLPAACLPGMKEIDNVRPLLMVPVWVSGLLRKTCHDPRLRGQVQGIWNDLVDRFTGIPFVRARCKASRYPLEIQKLKWALRISKRLLSPESSRLICWFGEKVARQQRSYCSHALQEASFKNHESRFIVYGHTHHHEMAPLDASYSEDSQSTQIYLNSGTWRPVHELTRLHPSHEVFAGYHTMTYLAFFKDDERNGRTFESWSGSLSSSKRGVA
ncbi:MAG: hypothetical protein ACRD1J_09520 [Terriglobia bacterium]